MHMGVRTQSKDILEGADQQADQFKLLFYMPNNSPLHRRHMGKANSENHHPLQIQQSLEVPNVHLRFKK